MYLILHSIQIAKIWYSRNIHIPVLQFRYWFGVIYKCISGPVYLRHSVYLLSYAHDRHPEKNKTSSSDRVYFHQRCLFLVAVILLPENWHLKPVPDFWYHFLRHGHKTDDMRYICTASTQFGPHIVITSNNISQTATNLKTNTNIPQYIHGVP